MRTVEECLDDLQDDSYAYTTTRNEFVDADLDESTTRAACNALISGDTASFNLFARSHFQAVIDAMQERAVAMQARSKNPLFEAFDEIMSGFPTIHKDAA